MDTEATDFRRTLVLERLIDKTGADDKVGLVVSDWLDELFEIRYIVLTVGVELDGDVVIIVASIFITSLDGAADAEIIN